MIGVKGNRSISGSSRSSFFNCLLLLVGQDDTHYLFTTYSRNDRIIEYVIQSVPGISRIQGIDCSSRL